VKKLALVAALLSAGCDDPAVTAKVSSVLEHGAVQAELRLQQAAPSTTCTNSSQEFLLNVHLFQDGSSLVSIHNFSPVASTAPYQQYNSAGNGIELVNPLVNGSGGPFSWALEIADGEMSVVGTCSIGSTNTNVDLSAATGFNLEAFGIEE
jgi:hypothetical protein